MNASTLSQDEVDSLLSGIADETPVPAAPSAAAPDVRSCDLASQERLISPQMPGLELIHKRFVRELGDGLLPFAQRPAEVSGSPVRVQKYGDFLAGIGAPTSANIVAMTPLRGNGLVVCEPALVCGLVDVMFGGSGRFPAKLEGRSFSPTEQRIIARLVDVVCSAYAKAWAEVHPLELSFQRAELLPQFANIARTSDVVVVSSYTITCGAASGALHLCFPYANLEPIREALYTTARGESALPERGWSQQLTQELQSAEVDLVAELAQTTATVAQLLALKPGDFMEVEMSPSIRALVDGVPVFHCHYGTSGGKNAIKIDQPITSTAPGWPGATHV